jgi:hypothetical protein
VAGPWCAEPSHWTRPHPTPVAGRRKVVLAETEKKKARKKSLFLHADSLGLVPRWARRHARVAPVRCAPRTRPRPCPLFSALPHTGLFSLRASSCGSPPCPIIVRCVLPRPAQSAACALIPVDSALLCLRPLGVPTKAGGLCAAGPRLVGGSAVLILSRECRRRGYATSRFETNGRCLCPPELRNHFESLIRASKARRRSFGRKPPSGESLSSDLPQVSKFG